MLKMEEQGELKIKGIPLRDSLYFIIKFFFSGTLISFISIISVLFCTDLILNFKCFDFYKVSNCLIGSVFEELFFRLLIYEFLRKKLKIWASILLGSLIFSIFHFLPNIELSALLGYFLGGIIYSLAYIMVKKDSNVGLQMAFSNLSFSIGLHFGWNFTQIFLGLTKKDRISSFELFYNDHLLENHMFGHFSGFEGGWLQLCSRFIILIILFGYVRKLCSGHQF
jgi:uncharacterized protein